MHILIDESRKRYLENPAYKWTSQDCSRSFNKVLNREFYKGFSRKTLQDNFVEAVLKKKKTYSFDGPIEEFVFPEQLTETRGLVGEIVPQFDKKLTHVYAGDYYGFGNRLLPKDGKGTLAASPQILFTYMEMHFNYIISTYHDRSL